MWCCVFAADPGTHADEGSWLRRFVSFLITVGGMLFFAIVVGFVVDAIRDRMEALKRGKSEVVESDHYLILGWSDKSFSLIRELILAMESEGGGVIVILSERDKDEIEGEVRPTPFALALGTLFTQHTRPVVFQIAQQFSVKEMCGTTVVCRTGSSLLVGDLNKVAASTARSVIILADSGPPDKADARTLRTVLSLIGMKNPPKVRLDSGGVMVRARIRLTVVPGWCRDMSWLNYATLTTKAWSRSSARAWWRQLCLTILSAAS